jgi:FolB domain-containing protein
MDSISLDAFEVECIIGILDSERITPQPLQFEVRLHLPLDGAAAGDLGRSVNYAAVLEQVTALAMGRWRLLESLGTAACRLFLAPPCPAESRALVSSVEITMRKPHILGGRAVPAVTIRRDRRWLHLPTRRSEGMVAEVLQETPTHGAYRVHIDPKTTWTAPDGAVVLAIAGDMSIDQQTVSAGTEVASVLIAGVRLK